MVVTFPIDAPDSWAGHEHYARRLLWRLARQPSLPTLYFQGRWLNGATLADAVRATAAGLRRAGLTPGGTVAVLTEPNHPAMLIGRYAAHLLGAAVVQVRSANPRSDAFPLPAATQARILDETGTSVILVDAPHLERARTLLSLTEDSPRLLGYGVGAADCPDALSYRDEPLGELPAHAPDRRALVAFTSGSGGTPKSIHQTFGVWDSTVRSAASGEPDERRVFLAVTPLSHTIGAMADSVLAAGGQVLLYQDFDAPKVLRAFEDHGVTDTYLAVPHLYRLTELLADSPGHGEGPGSGPVGDALWSLRRVVYSGTPAAPHRIAEALRVFGPVLVQLYGTTEAGGISNLSPFDHLEPELLGSVGRPLPWVAVEVREPGTGDPVPRGEAGEIWVRASTVVDGYPNDPEQTARVLRDGWLDTGDLGHWDRYGYLRLTGRSGQVIKSGGLKIYPAAVERALLSHPAVRHAAVHGVRDPDRTEYVHAAVVFRAGRTSSAEELRTHVGELLSPLHAPAEITFWDSMPLNERGKPDLACLRSGNGRQAYDGAPPKGTP